MKKQLMRMPLAHSRSHASAALLRRPVSASTESLASSCRGGVHLPPALAGASCHVATIRTAMRVRIGRDDDDDDNLERPFQPPNFDRKARIPPDPRALHDPNFASSAEPPSHLVSGEPDDVGAFSASPPPRIGGAGESGVVAVEPDIDTNTGYNPNALLAPPRHPNSLIPEYVRIKRTHRVIRILEMDPDHVQQKESTVTLPKPMPHPWVRGQPTGPYVRHGDGLLRVRDGSGEVGFDEGKSFERKLPEHWRGLNPLSVTGMIPPNVNGYVSDKVVVKHSFQLTGRGIFASRDIKKGEPMMIIKSSAHNVGWNSVSGRLLEMMRDVLVRAYHGNDDDLNFLHYWVMQGQQSSRIEHWPPELTEQLILMIGGKDVLDALELHPHHIARLASIVEMNSFVVEDNFDADKGQAYWPEAGYFNHSCAPNADYDILPLHKFKKTEDYSVLRTKLQQDASAATADSSAAAAPTKSADSERTASETPSTAATVDGTAVRSEGATPASHDAMSACAPAAGVDRNGDTLKDDPIDRLINSGTYTASSTSSEDPHTLPTDFTAEAGRVAPNARVPPQHAPCGDKDCSHCAPSATSATGAIVDPRLRAAAIREEEQQLLAPTGPYFFCIRANQDIRAGEEVLIAYVPPEWCLDDRQFVLLDRYKFRCKCPKCAPVFDARYKIVAKMGMAAIVFFALLQFGLYRTRAIVRGADDTHDPDNPLRYNDLYKT